MSYLAKLRDYYPKSWAIRHALNNWHAHLNFEYKEPTTVTIHYISQCYGGPEEGGWWYTKGDPSNTFCFFSKKQAIEIFVTCIENLEIADQEDLGLSTTSWNYDVNFSNGYATSYPDKRPHYC